ncbi:hypothetical protein DFH09DRAFT_1468566 [Mycena vulgaris]|nr:hypothetical protein DFH09DRAFT_1468566 [Mycena vulgaris]
MSISEETAPRPMVMEFATNSVRNTTLATPDDDPYYEIVTRFWHPHLTKINKLDPGSRAMTTVCEIDSKGKEAKIRFLDADKKEKHLEKNEDYLGEWVPSDAILKLAPEKPGGIFVDSDGVELIRCGDDGRLPVVTYHPHKRHFWVWRMSQHATLEIKPDKIKNLERLIASYLLVERQRRHHAF